MPNGCGLVFSHFVVRLVGVPCPQVKTAIVSQIKIMGSYKVSILAQTCTVLGPPPGSAVNLTRFVFFIQAGPSDSDQRPGQPHFGGGPGGVG